MLLEYAKPYKGRIIVNAIIKTLATVFEILMPAILAFMINDLVISGDRSGIVYWGIIMIVLAFLAWLTNIIANRMAAYTSSRIVRAVRHDLYSRAINLSAKQIDSLSISSLETRLTTDTYNIHNFFGVSLRMGIRSILLFLGGIAICFFLDWRLSLILFVMVPPIFLLIKLVFSKAFPMFRNVQTKVDNMVQVIRENIRGIRVSKALDKTEYEQGRFAERNQDVIDAEIKVTDLMIKLFPSINVIIFTGQALIIILGAYLASQGTVEAGIITAFLSYFLQIAHSFMAMNRMINIGTRAKTSGDRISEVMNLPIDDSQIIHGEAVETLPAATPEVPDVEFRNVTFVYDEENYELYKEANSIEEKAKYADLYNISFKVYPGDTLGIIGATGSGKSTIIKLLTRMYDPQEGEIFIRGINIKRISRELMHEMFGLVLQNDFIFSGTLENNIKFGRDITNAELEETTKYAQADDFIKDKGGLKFKLVARGTNLSGGQQQRVLLSRALSGNPAILVLDDSSSALDFATDARLRKALSENYAETTAFIIAQRISSIMHAQNILVLQGGKILDQGTHEELLKNCELYKEVADMQLGSAGSDFDSIEFFHNS